LDDAAHNTKITNLNNEFIINSFSVHYYSTKARYIHTLLSLFS